MAESEEAGQERSQQRNERDRIRRQLETAEEREARYLSMVAYM